MERRIFLKLLGLSFITPKIGMYIINKLSDSFGDYFSAPADSDFVFSDTEWEVEWYLPKGRNNYVWISNNGNKCVCDNCCRKLKE